MAPPDRPADITRSEWESLADDVSALRRAVAGAPAEGTRGLLVRVADVERLARWLVIIVSLSIVEQLPRLVTFLRAIRF